MSTHRQSAGAWIPPSAPYAPLEVPASPFAALESLPRAQWESLRALAAAERRVYVPHFVEVFHWEALRPHLPLHMAPLPEVPTWPGRRCRSSYQWLPPEATLTAQDWAGLDDFDLILTSNQATAVKPSICARLLNLNGCLATTTSWPAARACSSSGPAHATSGWQ